MIGSVVPARRGSRTDAVSPVSGSASARTSRRFGTTSAVGHIRAVSIGYQVQRYEIYAARPNGPELWRAVDWTPFEISAVPVGADPAAGFRSVDPLMPCVVTRDDASPSQGTINGQDPTARRPRRQPERAGEAPPYAGILVQGGTMEKRSASAERPAKPAAAATETGASVTSRPTAEALVARAQETERERVATIYDLAARLGLERAFAEDLVKRGVGIDEARRRDSRQGGRDRGARHGHSRMSRCRSADVTSGSPAATQWRTHCSIVTAPTLFPAQRARP